MGNRNTGAELGRSGNGMSSPERCRDATCSQPAFLGRNAHVRAAMDQNRPLPPGPEAKLCIFVDSVQLIFILWGTCARACVFLTTSKKGSVLLLGSA